MVVKRTYRRGKLIQKRLVVIVVFNNLNMLEGRRIGVGRVNGYVYEENVEHSPSASGRTPGGAHTDGGIGFGEKRKFTSPTRLDNGILVFTKV